MPLKYFIKRHNLYSTPSIIEECYLKAAEKLGNAMANEILK
ncbi:MAG: hypothetical protein PWP26_959 [Thermodesulfobacterium sp.]|jgi:hypothetical protein|nr:hypothetical protein [Thermodesulfobacterium sp.]